MKKTRTKGSDLHKIRVNLVNIGVVIVDISARLDAIEEILYRHGFLNADDYPDLVRKYRQSRLEGLSDQTKTTDETAGTAAPAEDHKDAEA